MGWAGGLFIYIQGGQCTPADCLCTSAICRRALAIVYLPGFHPKLSVYFLEVVYDGVARWCPLARRLARPSRVAMATARLSP
jgi:hypothetical protein